MWIDSVVGSFAVLFDEILLGFVLGGCLIIEKYMRHIHFLVGQLEQ